MQEEACPSRTFYCSEIAPSQLRRFNLSFIKIYIAFFLIWHKNKKYNLQTVKVYSCKINKDIFSQFNLIAEILNYIKEISFVILFVFIIFLINLFFNFS